MPQVTVTFPAQQQSGLFDLPDGVIIVLNPTPLTPFATSSSSTLNPSAPPFNGTLFPILMQDDAAANQELSTFRHALAADAEELRVQLQQWLMEYKELRSVVEGLVEAALVSGIARRQ